MANNGKSANQNLLEVTKTEQYRTVGELFQRSQPSQIYYTLLFLSVFIVAAGLLMNNSPIVIGGMLVTPLLTPVLVIALGIAVGDLNAIRDTSFLLLKSSLVVVFVSTVITWVFGAPAESFVLENSLRTALLYFIVAAASGVAATFAWVRKEIAEVLPGIAISVSVVPPLSLVGIWLAVLEFDPARFYFLIFIFNLVGIILGSLVVFSLLKFHKTEKLIQEKVEESRENK